jgi:hypothetical protein
MKFNPGQSFAAFGRPGGQPLVYADVAQPRLADLEALVVLLDQLKGGVSDLLVIVPPLAHEAVRIVVHLGRIRDVVALP